MTNIEKFITDSQKTIKFDRQKNNGKANYNSLQNNLLNLFLRTSSCPGELPKSIFQYWEKKYIYNSSDFEYEPKEENINKLAGFLGFLENTQENQEFISDEDWKELSQLVNYEADDLPLHILQDLMALLVSQGKY